MERIHTLVADARADRVFPAATVEVGRRSGAIWRDAVGTLTYDGRAAPCRLDTIFDLASLTKVIVTASVAMRLVDDGRLDLSTPVAAWISGWDAPDRADITPQHLLEHASGLPAHAPLWKTATDRESMQTALLCVPLERSVGSASIYSDVGFILLGLVLEAAGGRPLDELFEPLAARGEDVLAFVPPASLSPRIAPTEYSEQLGRPLRGEVHDENARALGGVGGHAGLFGNVTAVGAFARLVLSTFREPTLLGPPGLMTRFAHRSDVPGSSRALGWDTMLPTSSCGTRLSPTAIGHTGFTGTSLWIDWERDLYVVLLTNRVYPDRRDDRLVALRPRLHDAVVDAVTDARD
jgi:CubicO group peptidase (beta-lactamase class C family)